MPELEQFLMNLGLNFASSEMAIESGGFEPGDCQVSRILA